MPLLRAIVVLRGPGRVPGSPGVRLFLPLYPTRSMSAAAFSLPSILLVRLVRWSRCDVSSWGWSYVLHPVAFVAFAGLSLIHSKFPPSDCHFGSSQIFGQRFGSYVGEEEELGILGVSLRIIIRALACCWHLRMRCAGVCGGAPHPLSLTSLVGN